MIETVEKRSGKTRQIEKLSFYWIEGLFTELIMLDVGTKMSLRSCFTKGHIVQRKSMAKELCE